MQDSFMYYLKYSFGDQVTHEQSEHIFQMDAWGSMVSINAHENDTGTCELLSALQ